MKVHQWIFITMLALSVSLSAGAQQFLTGYDSTLFVQDTLRPLVKRFENLHLSAYIQPQFQVVQQKGAESFSRGDFQNSANNRFMLRRARMKIDYKMPSKKGSFPAALFTFQFEATERNVNVRDMFVRIFEPSGNHFSLTAGLFARPFGYEVNLSSSVRETPERGRMSQVLMPSERDLGAMLTFESQKEKKKTVVLKWDAGIFNGQGKAGPAEFDSYKDFISRLSLQPVKLMNDFSISGGLSLLHGAVAQATKYKYNLDIQNGTKLFIVDSNSKNLGGRAPRYYYGADVQASMKQGERKTELRAEYWRGTQPGTSTSTLSFGTLPNEPTYIRAFDGAFLYFIQNIVNDKWEIVAKYDWYDPNTKVSKKEIGKSGTNLTAADVKFTTFGFGVTYYFTNNLKALAYYDWVQNEQTSLTGFMQDIKDNVLTLRIQMKF